VESALISATLLYGFDVAEFQRGGSPRALRWHPGEQVIVRLHLDVRVEFVCHIRGAAVAEKGDAQPA
jgi:hypothetical protein